ncbi:hypothetical protein F4802DRAFT_268462 [Xylaria palmicola]|nr:hypothetical protein F4802DRAFT_268462 [Xylaria palmicola]
MTTLSWQGRALMSSVLLCCYITCHNATMPHESFEPRNPVPSTRSVLAQDDWATRAACLLCCRVTRCSLPDGANHFKHDQSSLLRLRPLDTGLQPFFWKELADPDAILYHEKFVLKTTFELIPRTKASPAVVKPLASEVLLPSVTGTEMRITYIGTCRRAGLCFSSGTELIAATRN